jgi:hypothetical protein
MLAPAFAARAEGKCGDDPVQYGPGRMLVVTWTLPYPKKALVRMSGRSVFDDVDAKLGAPSPKGYQAPKPTEVTLFNDTDLAGVDAFVEWETRTLGFDPTTLPEWSKAKAKLEEYVPPGDEKKRDYALRGGLVEHPALADPKGFSVCTCILQRGVLILDGDQEDLWVRATFQTSKKDDARKFTFMPRDGWWFSFKSSSMWFPLRLNELQTERSWLVLDLLVPTPREFKGPVAWGNGLEEIKRGQVQLFGKTYNAVRLHREFAPRTSVPDVRIDPKAVLK